MHVLAADTTVAEWVAFLTPLMLAITMVLQQRGEKKANKDRAEAKQERVEVKEKVEDVKTELKDNTAKTDKIHKQLNGERSIMLHTIAALARKVSDLTGKPEDISIAEVAERVASDHDAQK